MKEKVETDVMVKKHQVGRNDVRRGDIVVLSNGVGGWCLVLTDPFVSSEVETEIVTYIVRSGQRRVELIDLDDIWKVVKKGHVAQRLNIELVRLVGWVPSVYNTSQGLLPNHMMMMEESAAEDFGALMQATEHKLRFTDIYRSFSRSLNVRRRKGRIAARPGFSGHNYGVSFDIDVEYALETLRDQGIISDRKVKRATRILEMQNYFARFGWKPLSSVRQKFRDGARRAVEEWHFNHIGRSKTVEAWVKANILKDVSKEMSLKEFQSLLQMMGYSVFPVDGKWGKKTKRAMNQFQDDYAIDRSKQPNALTIRTLRVFTSNVVIRKDVIF